MQASIIITTFRRSTFLERAIESAMNQYFDGDFEVIVVDDNGNGSPDQRATERVVDRFPAVQYLALENNSGACAARNSGAEIAKGDYLFFLDDDDVFFSNKLQVQSHYLEANCNVSACLAAFQRVDQATKKEIVSRSNFPVVGDFKHFVIHGNFFTPMLCIRRSVFMEVGGMDSISRFQDRYFMLKLLSLNYNVEAIPNVLHQMFEHNSDRITSSSIGTTLKALDQIKERVKGRRLDFTKEEWKAYIAKDCRMRATAYYIGSNYRTRRKAFCFYFKAFGISRQHKDLVQAIKSGLKF